MPMTSAQYVRSMKAKARVTTKEQSFTLTMYWKSFPKFMSLRKSMSMRGMLASARDAEVHGTAWTGTGWGRFTDHGYEYGRVRAKRRMEI